MSLNYFNQPSVPDGTYVTSTIDKGALVTAIQNIESDTYFDQTSEIGKVYVDYIHEDGRQRKRVVHQLPDLEGLILWSEFARDGTWEKTLIKAFDQDGAIRYMNRSQIGTSEDITHQSGTTFLNVS